MKWFPDPEDIRMVNKQDMRLYAGVFFLFIFLGIHARAQEDTLLGTISVKKNKKRVKTVTVFNYPELKSKKKDAVKTEFSKYDTYGNIFIHYNYYNQTNETYDYDSLRNLITINVFNTYLRTYMYRDSMSYDEKGRMISKTRFSIEKFNVGRRDVTPLPNSGTGNYVPEGVIFEEEYKYDDKGKLSFKGNKRETQFAYFAYTYDSAGNETQEKAVNVRNKSLSGKLVLDTQVVISYMKYDEAGNCVSFVTKNTRGEVFKSTIDRYDAKGHKVESQVYNSNFELVQKYTYSYDEYGNMTEQLYADYRSMKGSKPVLYSETKIKYEYEFY
jgi:hypothetical protein